MTDLGKYDMKKQKLKIYCFWTTAPQHDQDCKRLEKIQPYHCGFKHTESVEQSSESVKITNSDSGWGCLANYGKLTFENYSHVDNDISVHGALSDAEILNFAHLDEDKEEDEEEQLPIPIPKGTYITAEASTMPSHKPMKDHLTFLLYANASGDLKVKQLLE
ncbi:hypothetical protein LAZ67_X000968 [Cordylochernes scorpioides]|uniref:Uncharacterized protein n=1 Tax=Cordylochernes scorpioides TaxID=51811 RepID=A0ABY6LW45_9ARAC|nr:hypothetical protein LAZ67_X000968 [Cordylochernes scorpioides]